MIALHVSEHEDYKDTANVSSPHLQREESSIKIKRPVSAEDEKIGLFDPVQESGHHHYVNFCYSYLSSPVDHGYQFNPSRHHWSYDKFNSDASTVSAGA